MKSSKILLKDGQTVDLVDGRIADGDIASWKNKLNKVSGATAGDVATLDANGNLVDSGVNLNPSTNTMSVNISGEASSAKIASATTSGSIQANDDLNSYNAANRNYICNSNNASTVYNKPSGASGAFELEVIRGTGDTCVQVYYSRDDVNFNYIRKRTGINNAWTDWVKLMNSDDTVASANTANKLGSANVGFPYMPIYLLGGTPNSIEGYFFSTLSDPTISNLNKTDTKLDAVGGRKYVYNVSTSNTFTITLASTASSPISFAVRLKCTANCPNVDVTYKDALEKATLTRHVYLYSGRMVDMCFTYYLGYFHLVSISESSFS